MLEKRIEAKDYQYEFRYAWKNSTWHLYEPVSFDLVEPRSIVEKASRWLGRGHALQDATERFTIHFLLGEPRQPGREKEYQHALHLMERIPVQKELVGEGGLEHLADSLAGEIAAHPES